MSPLGLPLDFSGPWSIRANDQRILNESDFVNKLATIGGNNNYRIYGDQAYTLTPVVYRPWPKAMLNADRRAVNERMSSVRVCVENIFGLTHNLWPFVVTKSCLRLRASPVATWYTAAVLLTCKYSCLRGNSINSLFKTRSINLESWVRGHPQLN